MKKTLKGFTLVELLVVIAIIGLLSTVAVVSLNSARTKSRDAKRVADIKQIQTALELFFNDNTRYPQEDNAAAIGTGAKTVLTTSGFVAGGATTYMGLIPRDPSFTTAAAVVTCPAATAGVCDYTYEADGATATTYKLNFYLEGTTAGLDKGLKCATQDGIKDSTGSPEAC